MKAQQEDELHPHHDYHFLSSILFSIDVTDLECIGHGFLKHKDWHGPVKFSGCTTLNSEEIRLIS